MVVFNINGRDIPIVHRIIKVHEKEPGAKGEDVLILTKVRAAPCARGRYCSLSQGASVQLTMAKAISCSLEYTGTTCAHVPVAYHMGQICLFFSEGGFAQRPAERDVSCQGDNNWGDDRALYNEGQKWLHRDHLMGRVVG